MVGSWVCLESGVKQFDQVGVLCTKKRSILCSLFLMLIFSNFEPLSIRDGEDLGRRQDYGGKSG